MLVAAAANFSAPLAVLVEGFEGRSGHRVLVSYGASGRLFAQISNGAPFQVFLSADQDKPARLEAAGMTVGGSRFTYAVGSLVLWSRDEGLPSARSQEGLARRLRRDDYRRLALANPRLAPYGKAAVEVLENLGLVGVTRGRWVRGENIAQTYQFVSSGNAELGFVALSQVMEGGEITRGGGWVVPSHLHGPIRQDGVLLRRGEGCEACREFIDYLRSVEGRRIIGAFGYGTEPGQTN